MPKAKYTKRKDGRYLTHVDGGHREDGSRIRITVSARTISELEEKIRQKKNEIEQNPFGTDREITFKQYSDKYLAEKEVSSTLRTYEMYDQILTKYGTELSDRKLWKISRQDIQRIINENQSKPRTCEKIKLVFNGIFKKALIDGIITRNPCIGLELPRYHADEKRPLTDSEKILLEAADLTDKQRVFVTLGQYYGLRKSEIIALKRDSFDFNENLLFVNHSTEFRHDKPYEKDTKNHESRTLKMIPAHAEMFYSFIDSLPDDGEPHLFRCEDHPGWMDQSSFRRMWSQIIAALNTTAAEMKLPKPQDLTCHVLRHEFCTNLYYMGIDLREAQKLTGHKTLTVLSDIYVHLDNAKRDPRDKMTAYYEQERIRRQKELEKIQSQNSQQLKS